GVYRVSQGMGTVGFFRAELLAGELPVDARMDVEWLYTYPQQIGRRGVDNLLKSPAQRVVQAVFRIANLEVQVRTTRATCVTRQSDNLPFFYGEQVFVRKQLQFKSLFLILLF